MNSIKINGQTIRKGESRLIRLQISKLPTGTMIDIPVYVYRGKRKGPTLLLQAGLHGDEVNGIEIIRRLLKGQNLNVVAGTVILIPILNIFGFIHFSRDIPNGKDVNRSFPGTKSGSLASRVAYTLMNEIFPHIDYAIDFHTGGGQKDNNPQVRYTPGDLESLKLAKIFAPPFILPSGMIKKSFRATARKYNVPVIVYEAGESLRFEENAILYGIEGAMRVMSHMGIISEQFTPPMNEVIELTGSKWIRAKRSGLFYPFVHNGSIIEKNDIIGSITDTYGEYDIIIKSPERGYILCVNRQAVVNQGDAIIRLGRTE